MIKLMIHCDQNTFNTLPKAMKQLYLLLVCLVFIVGCKTGDCNALGKFSSYEDAISKVKSASFNVTETLDAERSSWIKDVSYYSCDGLSGYLILKTSEKEYIHYGVPSKVWESFKGASSLGSFYDHFIRGRYGLVL